jgi:hypothetical protein
MPILLVKPGSSLFVKPSRPALFGDYDALTPCLQDGDAPEQDRIVFSQESPAGGRPLRPSVARESGLSRRDRASVMFDFDRQDSWPDGAGREVIAARSGWAPAQLSHCQAPIELRRGGSPCKRTLLRLAAKE